MEDPRSKSSLERKISGQDDLHSAMNAWQAWCARRLMEYGHDHESAIDQAQFLRYEIEVGLQAHQPFTITSL